MPSSRTRFAGQRAKLLSGFLLLALFCQARPLLAQTVLDFSPQYLQAVLDAQSVGAQIDAGQAIDPSRISHNLTTLSGPPATPVVMSIFTDFTGYNRLTYSDAARGFPLFATADTELYNFIRTSNVPQSGLDQRVKQLLGLPQNLRSDRVVEVMAAPQDIIRPERDPSVTNPVSATAFPSGINPGYITYFRNTVIDNRYAMPPGNTPFPFTQLGYTYDYGNPKSVIGLSEFLILPPTLPNPVNGAAVTGIQQVVAVVSLLSYRYYDRQGNFDVQGDIDTIWAGTKYVPATGSNFINIHPGVTVAEGITVSSTGYTITNAGTILGPGKNFDRTFRDGVVEFEHGGTLINSGTISGPIGVFAGNSPEAVSIQQNGGLLAGYLFAAQLGAGDDQMVVRGGAISGTLDGGGGTNSLQFALAPGGGIQLNSSIVNFQATEIVSGNVQLNGSVSGDVVVDPGAKLSGVGPIAGNLTSGGTVDPGLGNGNSNLHVGGNYTQQSTGVLDIHVTKPLPDSAESNQLIVGGTATLAAGSTIFVDHVPGGQDVFRSNDRFQIIAAGSLLDNGAVIRSNSAFLTFTRLGGATSTPYTLVLNRTASFASAATAANSSLANALDADVNSSSGPTAAVFNELLFMNQAQFNQAASQLLPTAYFDPYSAVNRTTQYLEETLGLQLRNRFLVPQAPCFGSRPDDDEWHAFANPFGTSYGQTSSAGQVGFTANTAGVLAGVDRLVNEETLLGVQFGYGHNYVSLRGDDGSGGIDNYRVGPYLGWFSDGWYLIATPTYGLHTNQLSRNVVVGALSSTPQGNWTSNDVSTYFEGGRSLAIGDYSVLPLASLQYTYLWQNSFTENQGNGADLHLDSAQLQSLRSRLLLQVSRAWSVYSACLVPSLYGGWGHEYLSSPNFVANLASGMTTFSTTAPVWYRDSGIVGARLALWLDPALQISARYQGEFFGSSAQIHYGEASLVYLF